MDRLHNTYVGSGQGLSVSSLTSTWAQLTSPWAQVSIYFFWVTKSSIQWIIQKEIQRSHSPNLQLSANSVCKIICAVDPPL